MDKIEFGRRLRLARKEAGLTQKEAARRAGITQPSLSELENGHHEESIATPKLAAIYGVSWLWLSSGKGEMHDTHLSPKELLEEDDANGDVGKIPYWEARGSCGGGFLNYDQLPMGHLVKEASFFRKYDLKPENAIAVYADGDSQADFIVHGDIVIFDRSKTEPRSGHLFLIEHPDGLRIKQLRREIDGTWVLESRNPDKRKFPDERVSPDQMEHLRIVGQFKYRQGG